MSGMPNDSGAMQLAAKWMARMTTVLAELVVPAAAGAWLDQAYKTSWGTLVGLAVGVPLAMWHLIRLVQADDSGKSPPLERNKATSESGDASPRSKD